MSGRHKFHQRFYKFIPKLNIKSFCAKFLRNSYIFKVFSKILEFLNLELKGSKWPEGNQPLIGPFVMIFLNTVKISHCRIETF